MVRSKKSRSRSRSRNRKRSSRSRSKEATDQTRSSESAGGDQRKVWQHQETTWQEEQMNAERSRWLSRSSFGQGAIVSPSFPRHTEKLASGGALSVFAEPPLPPSPQPAAAAAPPAGPGGPAPQQAQPAMAMVNMNSLLNGKDSRWLQLEVCREFQRNKCSRPDTECKFAHPPANVEVQNGRVTACYDSIKGRCNREKPPCKYFHPPQHLKDQLLINGRNHLALKNALMQQMGLSPGQPMVAGQVQTVATNPYLTSMPQVGGTFSPYFTHAGPIMPAIMGPDPSGVTSPLGMVQQTVVTQQKMPRSDRLEPGVAMANVGAPQDVGKKRSRDPSDDMIQMMDMKSVGSFYYENFAFPGMVPYKRPAADKSGLPMYQPNTTYQQLMQLQQPFVPVSFTGHPPGVPRF